MPKQPQKKGGKGKRQKGSASNATVPRTRGDMVSGWGASPRMGGPSGLPDRLAVDLKYTQLARINPGVVAYSDTVFDLNNLFDPERTGTGHQPREFDQLAALYLYYRVYECLVEVEVRQRASHGIRLVLIGSNSATSLTPSDFPAEQRRAVQSIATGSSSLPIRVVRKYDIASILGMTKMQFLASEDTDAAVTTGPELIALLHMYVEQLDGATAVDFEYDIRMTFRAVFHEKKTLGVSSVARPARRSELFGPVRAMAAAAAEPGCGPAPPPAVGGGAGAGNDFEMVVAAEARAALSRRAHAPASAASAADVAAALERAYASGAIRRV